MAFVGYFQVISLLFFGVNFLPVNLNFTDPLIQLSYSRFVKQEGKRIELSVAHGHSCIIMPCKILLSHADLIDTFVFFIACEMHVLS